MGRVLTSIVGIISGRIPIGNWLFLHSFHLYHIVIHYYIISLNAFSTVLLRLLLLRHSCGLRHLDHMQGLLKIGWWSLDWTCLQDFRLLSGRLLLSLWHLLLRYCGLPRRRSDIIPFELFLQLLLFNFGSLIFEVFDFFLIVFLFTYFLVSARLLVHELSSKFGILNRTDILDLSSHDPGYVSTSLVESWCLMAEQALIGNGVFEGLARVENLTQTFLDWLHDVVYG